MSNQTSFNPTENNESYFEIIKQKNTNEHVRFEEEKYITQ